MERPYIDWVRIEDFRCVRQADIHLTPLHALIGPNDSGKSSLLQGIAQKGKQRFWSTALTLTCIPGSQIVAARYPNLKETTRISTTVDSHKRMTEISKSRVLLSLDPDELRDPVSLIPQGGAIWFQSHKGRGLAALYDALLNRDRDAFVAIDLRFRQLFPTVRALRLENADDRHKTMALTLLDGTFVGPTEMSEGMLYWLAFAIIEHLTPQSMLLIEEPENGLHPARIAEVMRVLRDVSQRTQVIVATHSPLVINELKPEEVTIVTRTPERGTICTPMIETKNFAERSKIYALGELWLAYADGDLERELVDPSTEAAKAG